jgi:hypothetical protein
VILCEDEVDAVKLANSTAYGLEALHECSHTKTVVFKHG